LCAADRATTVFTARSLVDCQRRCSTQKTKCYAANFYSDTKTCKIYNLKPTNFTSSKHCQLFAVRKLFSSVTGAVSQHTDGIDR
jgi:PAN domain